MTTPCPYLTRRHPEPGTRPSPRGSSDTGSRHLPFQDAAFLLLPPPSACLQDTWKLPVSGVQGSTFSIWQSLTRLILCHSVPGNPWQFVTCLTMSVVKAPIAFGRDFCQRAYQHVIIACLNVSLPFCTRSSLKTDCFPFLAHLWILMPSTLLGIPQAVCMFPRWVNQI